MIHSQKDIESSDNGDLILENGDLKMATVSRSVLQAVQFIVATDYGEYVPLALTGANLGSFIGGTNSVSNRRRMETSIQFGIDTQALVDSAQIFISVVPLGINEALVILKLPLIFLEEDPDDVLTEPLTVGFIFPYINGDIEIINLPSVN